MFNRIIQILIIILLWKIIVGLDMGMILAHFGIGK